ncbi:MAG: 2-oxoacid:acceptor oxidoreductase subunit alpha, partial [Jatrophihabitantaceae bacterium]
MAGLASKRPASSPAVRRSPNQVSRGATERMSKNVEQLDRVVIRIAGDSGDGMQLTGDRFTKETAMFGNDLATFQN